MDSVHDDAKGIGYRRIEVLTGPGRRRKLSDDDKARIIAETAQPGAVMTEVARRWQVTPQQVFDWRRQARRALAAATAPAEPAFVPIVAARPRSSSSCPARCCALRQERSRPLVEDLFAWLSVQLAHLPGSSPTVQAIRYVLNHREGLVRFLDDRRIELDTNTVERAIRPICLSRKNALFASGD